MTQSEKILSTSALETAEMYRAENHVLKAAIFAGAALGYPSNRLTDAEVLSISENPIQRTVLACLARIYVDASKTRANQEILPHKVLYPLLNASLVIHDVYNNVTFRSLIDLVTHDHVGRQHHFGPEMNRDKAKVLFAASDLFCGERANDLVEKGLRLLEETYESLPNGHPTKPLIGIEIQLVKISRGDKFDKEKIIHDFTELVANDEPTNPQRVATVASWLTVWGERIDDKDIHDIGLRVFTRIIGKHPEWAFMKKSEKRKLAEQNIRRKTLKVLAPVMTYRTERDNLFNHLTTNPTTIKLD